MASNKFWSKEEVNYLMDNWGTISVKSIAKNLGRTENAILIKKNKLKLGRFDESGEYITWNKLITALGLEGSMSYKTTSWIKNRNFPVKKKKILTSSVRVVYLDDFWEWVEENKNFVDFSNFKKGMLGAEPDWVENKRKYDILTNSKYKKTPWTPKDDEYLSFLLKQHKYSYDEISKMTSRTTGAIQKRISDLGLMERPVKADNHTKWTDNEKEIIEKMILEGAGYEMMSERIGRSSKAIRGYIFRAYGSESLDKACNSITIKSDTTNKLNKWTDDEKELLEKMILEGSDYEMMSERIGRSSKSIRGYVLRTYGSSTLDKASNVIRNNK